MRKISDSEHWMGMAVMAAAASQLKRKQSCIIIDENDKILSIGVNSFDATTNRFICAETNALFSCCLPLNSATAFVTHLPCDNCISNFHVAKVERIIYLQQETETTNSNRNYMNLEIFTGNLNWMRDYLKSCEVFSS